MFVSRLQRTASIATPVVSLGAVRNMATLKEIQMRLKSVSNIAKITKSMKMIASTKMAKAQRLMEVARVYGDASSAFSKNLFPAVADAEKDGNVLAVAVSSDRGLCGGIHSSISKAVKKHARDAPSTKIVIIGQKAKPQIAREARDKISITFDQVSKVQPTWDESALIADAILAAKLPFDKTAIFFNRFKSVIAFETDRVYTHSLENWKKSDKLAAYEYDEQVLQDYAQFALANALYATITEGNASEMAAKRTAMENATKNAGEMIQKLTLTYNRSRQATITNELVDIITGAAAAV